MSLGRLLRRSAARLLDQQLVCGGNRETLRGLFSRDSIVLWHFGSFARKRAQMRGWAAAASGPPVVRLRRPAHGRAFVEAETARRTSDQAGVDPS